MPRLDGTLYHYEKPQPVKAAVKVSTPVRVVVRKGRTPHPLRPSKGGRPATIKATPELVEAACADIELGLPIESALVLRGISRKAMDKWRAINPAVEQAFANAESRFERRMVLNIESASKRDPKCSQWLLERRASQRWAQVTKAELTGKGGGPLQSMTISKQLFASVASDPDRAKNVKPTAKPRAIDV